MNCKTENKSFMCMRKGVYVRRQHTSLVCYNPKCVSQDERKVITIAAEAEREQRKNGLNNYSRVCTNKKVEVAPPKKRR